MAKVLHVYTELTRKHTPAPTPSEWVQAISTRFAWCRTRKALQEYAEYCRDLIELLSDDEKSELRRVYGEAMGRIR